MGEPMGPTLDLFWLLRKDTMGDGETAEVVQHGLTGPFFTEEDALAKLESWPTPGCTTDYKVLRVSADVMQAEVVPPGQRGQRPIRPTPNGARI